MKFITDVSGNVIRVAFPDAFSGASRAELRQAAPADAVNHSTVQPWSAGPLFPAVIGRVERYTDDGAIQSVSACLMLDGHEEEYATREDAEEVARALLRDADMRASWRARAGAAQVLPAVMPWGPAYFPAG